MDKNVTLEYEFSGEKGMKERLRPLKDNFDKNIGEGENQDEQ